MNAGAFSQLAQQINRNPRLKWGLLLAAVLGSAFAIQALDGWRVRQQQRSVEIETETRRLIALKKQQVWVARASEAAALEQKLNSQIPVATSPGVAQATLQNTLRENANAIAGIKGLNVEVKEPVAVKDHPGLYRVDATLNAQLHPTRAFDLIDVIESSTNLAVIEGSTIRSGEGQQITLNVAAFFRTSDTEAAETTAKRRGP